MSVGWSSTLVRKVRNVKTLWAATSVSASPALKKKVTTARVSAGFIDITIKFFAAHQSRGNAVEISLN